MIRSRYYSAFARCRQLFCYIAASLTMSLTVSLAYAAEQVIDIEKAKSDMLMLDTDISKLEHELLYPSRTQILFGFNGKSQNNISRLEVTLDGSALSPISFTASQIKSLNMGGMINVFDSNLSKGKHTLSVAIYTANSDVPISQNFKFIKARNKNILGIRYVNSTASQLNPIKLLEWPLSN